VEQPVLEVPREEVVRRVLPWVGVAAGSAVAGWLFCFISALVVFRKFQPVDFEVPLEDDDE
jgi:hypothetical protein